jgi:transcriptional regulator with XRE-family HTH domain
VLRAARQLAELTQGELAQILGVSYPAVSYWECGRKTPTIAHLEAFARACRVSFTYGLAGWSWEPGHGCDCTEVQADECGRAAVDADCDCACHYWSAEELARGQIVGAKLAKKLGIEG